MFILLLYQIKSMYYLKRVRTEIKLQPLLIYVCQNTHLNIRKNPLDTFSGSGNICCCIETCFRRLAWSYCRWFRLEAQSFVTDFTLVNG